MGEMVGPFVGSWAVAAGLVTAWGLRGGAFVRVFPDVYVPQGYRVGVRERAVAAGCWAKMRGVLVGVSAMAMFGSPYVDEGLPAEIALESSRYAPRGVRVVRYRIGEDEWCEVDGFRVTTPVRTAYDIARKHSRDVAVPLLDSHCATTGIRPEQVVDFMATRERGRVAAQVRAILALVDPGAESPQESRTRLFLMDRGFPRPQTQIAVYDEHGKFVARVDMGWREWRIGIEYDGAHHWTDPQQRARDIDRLVALESVGWLIIRLTAAHLRSNPTRIVTRLEEALTSRGIRLNLGA
ncbi:endonuclease domain-containing protein [Nocardia sp. NPDC059240]|uniref:endonuclease domain-containing protein n=1 Tax=Nocardia sp. NPDC059240 TaxID=3346786 RepID=UPI003675E40B